MYVNNETQSPSTQWRYRCSLNFVPHQPNQNRDSTICRKPNGGPKHEKKQTVMIPSRLKEISTRMASTKPSPYRDFPRTPIANELTTILAASHYAWSVEKKRLLHGQNWPYRETHHAANVEVRSIGLLFCWHSLNPALLDVEPLRQSLYFRIQRIPIFETFPRNCIVTINVDRGVAHGWSLFEIGVDTTEHDYGTALLPCKCEARIIRTRYQRLAEERQAQRSNKIKKEKEIRAENTS